MHAVERTLEITLGMELKAHTILRQQWEQEYLQQFQDRVVKIESHMSTLSLLGFVIYNSIDGKHFSCQSVLLFAFL